MRIQLYSTVFESPTYCKRYLRDTPQEKNAVLAQPGFVAYQAKSRAAHQQQTTKSQGKKQ